MKFNDKEIQEALKKRKTVIANNQQDKHYFFDPEGLLKAFYTSTNSIIFCTYAYNDLMKMDWQIVEEPEYEYLWVVKDTDNSPRRRITMNYYKSKEDASKAMYNVKVLERCEWSKRRINNEN